jgi:hypothetical protein
LSGDAALIVITVFHGFDGRSQGILLNVRLAAQRLADMGYVTIVEEVAVPAVDEFEASVMVNGVPVPVPSIEINVDRLAQYMLDHALGAGEALGLPSPPLRAAALI